MNRATLVRLVLTHAVGAVIAVGIVFGQVANPADFNVTVPTTLLLIMTLTTGWLLAAKLPRNPVGWVLMWIAACFDLGIPLQMLGDALRSTNPGAAAWAYWIVGDQAQSWAWLPPVWALLIWIPLHFPNGRLPSARWRWVSWCTIALLLYGSVVVGGALGPISGLANPVGIPEVQHNGGPYFIVFAVLAFFCFGATITSLVVRYRHAAVVERSQLRWMLWSVAMVVLFFAITAFLPAGPATDIYDDWGLVLYGLVPVSISIAVLRYRLYEIDRIISRTAAYVIVTLVVVGTYAVVVLLVGLLLPGVQSVGVALATLAAAAVFLPVLRWVRHGINRVFDRAQYNAERVVDAFGERVRNGADPHAAGADLTAAIQQTLQPSAIGIWTPR